MATHCQTAVQSGSGERQNIGVVDSFEGKKEGGGGREVVKFKPSTLINYEGCSL